MAYLETSAALNINIDKIFEMLSGKIYQIFKEKMSVKKSTNRISVLSKIDDDPKIRKRRKCCEWLYFLEMFWCLINKLYERWFIFQLSSSFLIKIQTCLYNLNILCSKITVILYRVATTPSGNKTPRIKKINNGKLTAEIKTALWQSCKILRKC